MATIGIDPGHGGADVGAVGMGYQEKDIALEVGLRLRDRLKEAGFKVVMSRDGDWKYHLDQGADLSKRAQVFNNAQCDAVISLHMNSAAAPAWGVETYTWNGNNIANKFGDSVHSAIKHLNPTNRGRKFANFAILRETYAPACLVEMSFINSNDVQNVVGHEGKWADALCKGICAYFGVTPKKSQKPSKPAAKKVPDWALEDYQKAKANGFTDGTRLFEAPTRLEMALVAQRIYEKIIEEK